MKGRARFGAAAQDTTCCLTQRVAPPRPLHVLRGRAHRVQHHTVHNIVRCITYIHHAEASPVQAAPIPPLPSRSHRRGAARAGRRRPTQPALARVGRLRLGGSSPSAPPHSPTCSPPARSSPASQVRQLPRAVHHRDLRGAHPGRAREESARGEHGEESKERRAREERTERRVREEWVRGERERRA